jgi:hypothetical protein
MSADDTELWARMNHFDYSSSLQVSGHVVGNDKHFQHLGVEDFQDVV